MLTQSYVQQQTERIDRLLHGHDLAQLNDIEMCVAVGCRSATMKSCSAVSAAAVRHSISTAVDPVQTANSNHKTLLQAAKNSVCIIHS